MRVAIVGCGLIGKKRAQALGDAQLVACADVVWERAVQLASTMPGATPETDWQKIVQRKDIDIVIVATTHDKLTEISLAALLSGKHVLVEKPATRRLVELEPLLVAAKESRFLVRVGFNHRYHRAIRKAKELIDLGAIGELMYIRGRYGHGGRLGYEKEWRALPEKSGGGEMIDQGVHLIDLSRWFLGDFEKIDGYAHTYYWNMPVEDNAFMLLRTSKGQVSSLHVSCTEWKNLFSFEVFGRSGKLEITGLGGTYGVERLTFYKMLPQLGPPETTIWEYPMGDDSWNVELNEFQEDIRLGRNPSANLHDAESALRIVENIYRISNYDYHS
jgi:predicted dehydrogenase